MRNVVHPAAIAALMSIVAACGGSSAADGGGVSITAADRQAAKIKFALCVTCHGPNGGGDGPASAGLVPQPRNLQDPAWQASVTDTHIEEIIVGGGGAVGKALAMPSNPDLKDKPGVVAALREIVRGLAKK